MAYHDNLYSADPTLNTTFCACILSKISYPSTASDKGIIFSNMNLQKSVWPGPERVYGLTQEGAASLGAV